MAAQRPGILRWEDPPEKARRSGRALFDADLVLDDLAAHPNKFAVIAEGVSQSYHHSSTALKSLHKKALLRHVQVETMATKVNGNGKHVVYARVVRRSPGRPRKAVAV